MAYLNTSNAQSKNLTYTDISFFGKALTDKIAVYAEGMKLIAAVLLQQMRIMH